MMTACSPSEDAPKAPRPGVAPADEASPAGAVDGIEADPAPAAELSTAAPAEITSGDDPLAEAIEYTCASGARIFARYDEAEDVILLQYGDTRVVMSPAMSASGARFVGGDWVWWGKGDEATLFTLLPDGETGEVIESCTELIDEAATEGP